MKFIFPLIFALTLAACDSSLTNKKDQITALNAIDNGALLVDVRTAMEVSTGSFDNAINIPHERIVAALEKLGVDKTQTIVVYCRTGNRSEQAKAALEAAGYPVVINGGGYSDLRAVESAKQPTQ
jgi:phage shock protein E